MTTRTDRNQTFDADGNLVSEEVVEVDTSEETNESTLRDRLTTRIAALQAIIDFPAVAQVPTGTMTAAQLSNVARATRDAVQENRDGIQRLAVAVRDLHRFARGDFSELDA